RRRMVRKFEQKPIPDDVLRRVLEVARHAPSGGFSQGFDFIAQPDKLQFGMDKEENWPVPFWTVDTSMAIMLILLASVNEGLGAWYFGITRGEHDVVRELGVPPSCTMLGVIALGYPSSEDKPRGSVFTIRRRPFEEMFHIGRW
ncbi:MAG: hypothetical protein E6J28_06695, partial [Chloroflexi bacterium]